ncbi:MAG: hypothetical protein WC796_03090 [Candidatus Pacearchaeota archaeon]|jgi:hypothetical protein
MNQTIHALRERLFGKESRVSRVVDRTELEILKDLKGIKIAEPGYWFNTRYDYAEILGGGREFRDSRKCDLRHGSMDLGDYSTAYLSALGQGSFVVRSEKLSRDVECDSVLRILNTLFGNSCMHYYFYQAKDTGFVRNFCPSMGGGNPQDYFENPSYQLKQPALKRCAPLIRGMELTLGRSIIDRD